MTRYPHIDMTGWSPEMRAYASAFLARAFAGETRDVPGEARAWEDHLLETGRKLNVNMRRSAEAYAERLLTLYDDEVRERIEHEYEHEGWDGRRRHWEPVSFDPEIHDMWISAIRCKGALKIVYESETSGRTERIVEPLRTQTPYGIAYCRLRREERKFRFDRISHAEVCGKRTHAQG